MTSAISDAACDDDAELRFTSVGEEWQAVKPLLKAAIRYLVWPIGWSWRLAAFAIG